MSQSQKEAAEYAEVLMAYSRGEAVQMRGIGNEEWRPLTYPMWDFGRYEYRVAPKPAESWARWGGCPRASAFYTDKADAEKMAKELGGRPILMREVTE